MKRTTFFVSLTAAAVAAFAASGDAEKEVAASVEAFNKAAAEGDGATLDKLLSADLVYVHSNALTEDKAKCIAALVKGKPKFTHSEQTIKIYDKTALVRTKATAVSATGTTPLQMIQVWVKGNKGWQLVSRHTVRLAS